MFIGEAPGVYSSWEEANAQWHRIATAIIEGSRLGMQQNKLTPPGQARWVCANPITTCIMVQIVYSLYDALGAYITPVSLGTYLDGSSRR